MQQTRTIIKSLADLDTFIAKIVENGKRFSYDVETDSLDWRTCVVTCSQLAYQDKLGIYHGCMIPHGFQYIKEVLFRLVPKGEEPLTEVREPVSGQIPFKQALQRLKRLFEDKQADCSGSNLKYDFLVSLQADPTIVFQCKVRDTVLSSALMHKPSNGLKENVMLEFQHRMLTFDDQFGGDASRSMLVPMEYMSEYCIPDVIYGLALANRHEEQLKALEQDSIHNKKYKLWTTVENPNVIYIAYMEFFGITLDCNHVRSMDTGLKARLEDLERQIYEAAGATPSDFSLSSATELIDFFLIKNKHWSEKDTEPTASSQKFKCDSPTLLKFSESNNSTEIGQEVAHLIIQQRKLEKLITTYMSLPDLVDEYNRLHTSFTQVFTASFRLSSRGPNLQNIPARSEDGRELRKAFISACNYRLVVADYSNAELRITAHITRDPLMLDVFINDKDLHEETAKGLGLISPELVEKVHKKTATKDESLVYKDGRGTGKTFNFATGYGAGVPKLRSQLNQGRKQKFSLKQVSRFKDLFWQTYAGYAKWRTDNVNYVKRTGFARSPFGYTQDFRSKVRARDFFDNQANNFPVQNTAGGMIKLAQANILRQVIEDGWFLVRREQLDLPQYSAYKDKFLKIMQDNDYIHVVKMLLQVHDELVMECVDIPEIVEYTKQLISSEMTNAARLCIPCPAEAGSGYNWLEAK